MKFAAHSGRPHPDAEWGTDAPGPQPGAAMPPTRPVGCVWGEGGKASPAGPGSRLAACQNKVSWGFPQGPGVSIDRQRASAFAEINILVQYSSPEEARDSTSSRGM
jgi:hypothetical protein